MALLRSADKTTDPLPATTRLRKRCWPISGSFPLDQATSIRRSAGAFYDANERIYAGYLQNVISFGKLRLQTGVRFDAADTSFNANRIVTADPNDPTVTRDKPQNHADYAELWLLQRFAQRTSAVFTREKHQPPLELQSRDRPAEYRRPRAYDHRRSRTPVQRR